MRDIEGQILLDEWLKQFQRINFIGCGSCICKRCLYYQSGRCPYGECFDDIRAIDNPYDKAHPDIPPRTGWSNWNKPGEQEHWCRGGTFYPVYSCNRFEKYKGLNIKECIGCNIIEYQDGYMNCSLVDSVGCEVCYRNFLKKFD